MRRIRFIRKGCNRWLAFQFTGGEWHKKTEVSFFDMLYLLTHQSEMSNRRISEYICANRLRILENAEKER